MLTQPGDRVVTRLVRSNAVTQKSLQGLAYLVYRALVAWPKFALARTPALYAIGSVAAYWSFGRILSIVA